MTNRREFFEDQLFRSLGNQRFTQDSPVFPDVWLDFALNPGERRQLLLTPNDRSTAPELAEALRERLIAFDAEADLKRAAIAPNMTTVAAALSFEEVICVLLPMTTWWDTHFWYGPGWRIVDWMGDDPEGCSEALKEALRCDSYQEWFDGADPQRRGDLTPVAFWLSHVAGTICIAGFEHQEFERQTREIETRRERLRRLADPGGDVAVLDDIAFLARVLRDLSASAEAQREEGDSPRVRRLQELAGSVEMVQGLVDLFLRVAPVGTEAAPILREVNRNRATEGSVYRSVKATKADAVRQLFDVRGEGVRWAVIDSGIDACHVAFRQRNNRGQAYGRRVSFREAPEPLTRDVLRSGADDPEGTRGKFAFCHADDAPGDGWIDQTRIVATYDFTRVRDLLSARDPGDLPEELFVRADENRRRRGKRRGAKGALRRALKFGGMVDWEQFEDFLRIPHNDQYEAPTHFHGTHVAGILGADWRMEEHDLDPPDDRQGVAPEIELYDLRALDASGAGDEFSIMAAMQFVRYLNLRRTGKDQMAVHGVNLSFSIKHEVANFACGRTPVCDEAERLVGAGIVVVAAAGNQGRARYETVRGKLDEGYRSISITDPGNAQSAITVGATHRDEPHTYGVSYFSSRGPTGDGRPKPDLVAPGENIYSTIPGNDEGNTDGTSQAAPHVSGAAALLMQRNPELIGDPVRIKQILCGSATDLGREHYFQGAGMLDILRALQSV